MIRVSHLRKTFGETLAVNDVSFDVSEGEVVGFLGPNGAGKSTTMRMLTTYLDPDAGAIEIAGVDVLADPLAARRKIGYLPESAPLYEELGVVESLRYSARIRGLRGGALRSRVDEMIDACGLQRVVAKDIGELSKGYRQRVGLAQTLLHDPEFLILDEPTTGLDPNQIREIRGLIREVGERRTVILSTHILPEVTATCTRALIIDQGQVVADGPPDELIAGAGQGQSRFRLSIRGATRSAAESALSDVPGVTGVTVNGAVDGVLRAVVHGRGDGLAEELFKAAVRHEWVLTELAPELASLEDVFSQLTGSQLTGDAAEEVA